VNLHHESCRLDELGAIAVRSVRSSADQKAQSVEFNIEPAGLTIVSDADGIIQSLQQLLNNAVKFTPVDGRIGLDVRKVFDQNAVQLVVWDTGIGISPEQQAVIFQPFVQGDAALSRKYTGMGLGLAYAQRMVELLGGSITLESTLGQGSRFTITLPYELAHTGSAPART
jgi:signal transduction histidine kinase